MRAELTSGARFLVTSRTPFSEMRELLRFIVCTAILLRFHSSPNLYSAVKLEWPSGCAVVLTQY